DPRELDKAADLLSAAERPAVVAGSGVWWDGAAAELARFAAAGRVPVYLNGSGRGSLPPGHELFFQHSRSTALEEADVVCAAGLGALADGVEPAKDDRAAWLEKLRAAEAAWWDAHRAEIESDASPIHH